MTWHSLDPRIVTVDAAGRAVSRAVGTVAVVARLGGEADTVVIESRQVVATVSVDSASAATGDEGRPTYRATARDSNGVAIPDAALSWRSSDPAVATVDAQGVALVVAPGVADIVASAAGASAGATIRVLALKPSGGGERARSADAFVESVGTNVHLSYLDRVYNSGYSTIILPKLRKLGIRHLRDGANVVNDDGWMQLVYGRMREVADLGIRFTLVGSRAEGVTSFDDVSHLDRLLRFVDPGSTVAGFEGLNEHDLSGRATWAAEVGAFQQALYASVKSDPRTAAIPVLGPSIAQVHRDDVVQAVGDLSQYMDYGAIHPYPGGHPPMTGLEYHRTRLRPVHGQRPVIATETGYHTAAESPDGHRPISERATGRYVPRLFLGYFAAGVVRTFAYELIDQGTSASELEQNFGLLRNDGSEKPAFTALARLVALLSDPGPAFPVGRLDYALVGDTAGIRQVLLQKRDGRFFLALWQEVPSYERSTGADVVVPDRPLRVRLARRAQRARSYLPLESAEPLTQSRNVTELSVRVPDHPLLIELLP